MLLRLAGRWQRWLLGQTGRQEEQHRLADDPGGDLTLLSTSAATA